MKRRHADCQIVKRKGTLYVICKSNPKFKARQGATAGTRLSKKGVKYTLAQHRFITDRRPPGAGLFLVTELLPTCPCSFPTSKPDSWTFPAPSP